MTGYTALTKAKDGTMVPLCNGSFLHSQYNPMREAEQFAAQFNDTSFFVVLGIGGGYHIAALRRRFITPRQETDAPDAETRTIVYSTVGGTSEIVQEVEVHLVKDTEDVLVEMLKWLDVNVNPLQEESRAGTPLLPTRTIP